MEHKHSSNSCHMGNCYSSNSSRKTSMINIICKFHSKCQIPQVKPLTQWEKLDMSGMERRKLCCSISFHMIAITCVVWSLYVLIDRFIPLLWNDTVMNLEKAPTRAPGIEGKVIDYVIFSLTFSCSWDNVLWMRVRGSWELPAMFFPLIMITIVVF